jgi:transcriptional regulator with XRE-family HTH domain
MHSEGKPQLRLLGDSVRRERKRLKISQEDFAELCDLHRTYIGQVERGEKNISFINILRIATAFRIKPSVLLDKADL